MQHENEYCNIQTSLIKEMWQIFATNPKRDIIKKKQDKNKETILALISALAILGELEKLKKLEMVNNEIENIFKSEFLLETEYLEQILNDICKYSYDMNSFILKLGNINISNIYDANVSQTIINEKIENKTNKQRIKDNKENLKDKLINNIQLFVEGVITLNTLISIVEKIYKSNADKTNTMFDNEIHRCTNKSILAWINNNNIKKVMYVSKLETRTCTECREDHGKIFNIEDAKELPRHVHCVCFYMPIINKRWTNNFGKVTFKNLKNWSDKQ